MNPFISIKRLAPLLAVSLVGSPVHAAAPAKPNIIVILVDDMGFSDIGCYGSEIPTPNLDQLAAGGVRFSQFYNGARCCPTRASLLTGLYPHQAGIGHMVEDRGQDGYRGELNRQCVTLPEVLRSAGYATYMTGKWHVTKHTTATTPEQQSNWPLQRGFEHYFGIISGKADYFHPDTLTRDNERLPPPGDGFYTTDAFVDNAIRFVNGGPLDQPFFLYLAFNAPHFPLMAPPDDIAKFRGKYMLGWDQLRKQRHAKQITLGIVDQAWPLAPRPPELKAWDSLSAAEQDRFDHIMAIYAACVNHMDAAVGRLVAALRQRGVFDHTLIVFLSDNGGNAESGPDGRLNGTPPGAAKSDVFCGQSWAMLENTPFRRYKHFDHEGGIATPFIASWPAGIKGRGEVRQQVGHLVDLMPTCVELAGAKYPSEFNGQAIQPMEGQSLVPAFEDQALARDALYWEHEGNAAVRAGDWKLVRLGRAGKWELYNLKDDRTEQHDLAQTHPERVQQLAAKWDAWAARTRVTPYPNEGKKPAKAAAGNRKTKP
ncbi:MAG: arylsulfatase [Verrucomicrobia bacterium]|nr:arylsulfatase [Verrucomicrobiota bacterium]